MTKTYKKLEPTQKLIVVNSRLRHGDMSKIAKKSETSPATVSAVIRGNAENSKILNVAYNMTRQRKENFQVIKDLQTKVKTSAEA